MANFNFCKVILGGRLTADVELKQNPSGVPVCSFSVAVNRKGKEQKTDFYKCIAWRSTAEFISRYFYKGSSICVVGNLQQREWKDKDGNKRIETEVIVDEANFVDSKADAPASEPAPAFAQTEQPHFEEIKTDDDLPF